MVDTRVCEIASLLKSARNRTLSALAEEGASTTRPHKIVIKTMIKSMAISIRWTEVTAYVFYLAKEREIFRQRTNLAQSTKFAT